MDETLQLLRSGHLKEAWASLEPVLAQDVRDSYALLLGTSILLKMGRYRQAIELGHRALQTNPQDSSVYELIGKGWQGLGYPLEALQAYGALVQLRPEDPDGYFGLADVFADLGSSFDRIEALSAGIDRAPSSERLIQLADLELALGRSARALTAARSALELDASDITANLIAGRSLTELGNDREAELYWNAAKREPSLAWRVEGHKGYVLSMAGRFDQAEACLVTSLRLNPDQGAAYELMLAGRRFTSSDEALVQKMRALADACRLSPEESAPLHFALGKALDDTGDPEGAMANYSIANSIRLQERGSRRPYVPEAESERWRLLRQLLSKKESRAEGVARAGPIFVVGMMRSGTTLLEQILSSHPQVVGAGELDFWYGSEALVVDATRSRIRTELLPERRATYVRLLESFGSSNCRVVDKFYGNLRYAGLLHELFPVSPILHIRRNPLDTAISMWMTDSSAAYLWERKHIIHAIRLAIEQAEFWRSILPANRFLDVRYEDLVGNPDKSTRDILEFCGLPWNEACLSPESVRKSVRTVSAWQVRQPIYRSSVNRWKRYEPWLGEFEELRDGD